MKWFEIKRRANEAGEEQVIYRVGRYNVCVEDDEFYPGGKCIYARAAEEGYYPDVQVNYGFKDKVQTIKIQTTAYGAMKPEEISKVIAGYQMAQEVAQDIQNRYPECF